MLPFRPDLVRFLSSRLGLTLVRMGRSGDVQKWALDEAVGTRRMLGRFELWEFRCACARGAVVVMGVRPLWSSHWFCRF